MNQPQSNQPQQLEEPFHETDRARLLRWIPWLHLFRAFRLSTRWQNLVLASLALLTLTAGHWGIAQLPFASSDTHDFTRVFYPWKQPTGDMPSSPNWKEATLKSNLEGAIRKFDEFSSTSDGRQCPSLNLIIPAHVLLKPHSTLASFGWAWTEILLILTIWSFFAGAITRRVLLEFSGQGEIGLCDSLRFAAREFPNTLGAPTIAVVGIGTIFFFGRCIGWIGAIPAVGSLIGPLFLGLQFVLALVMAFIVVGLAVCWPLMIASHSAEGTDGFDALNRAFNYLFVRPWYTLFMVAVSVVYGATVLFFLQRMILLTLHLTDWFNRPATPPVEGTAGDTIQQIWGSGVVLLLTAFPYSFFWTTTSLIYLLLRKSVDAYPLERVFIPQPKSPASTNPSPGTHSTTDNGARAVPLVGIPAANQREQDPPQPG